MNLYLDINGDFIPLVEDLLITRQGKYVNSHPTHVLSKEAYNQALKATLQSTEKQTTGKTGNDDSKVKPLSVYQGIGLKAAI